MQYQEFSFDGIENEGGWLGSFKDVNTDTCKQSSLCMCMYLKKYQAIEYDFPSNPNPAIKYLKEKLFQQCRTMT